MTEARSPGARFARRLPTGSSGPGAASGHRLRSLVRIWGRYLSVLETRQTDVLPSAQCPTQAVGQTDPPELPRAGVKSQGCWQAGEAQRQKPKTPSPVEVCRCPSHPIKALGPLMSSGGGMCCCAPWMVCLPHPGPVDPHLSDLSSLGSSSASPFSHKPSFSPKVPFLVS